MSRQRIKQHGLIGVLLLVSIAVIAVAVFSKNLGGRDPQAMQQQQTQTALKQAKEALLAYVESGNRTDLETTLGGTFWTTVNGRLPCPNTDGGGTVAGSCGTGASTATGVSSLGLFPWRTLDMPIIRDGANECLWYAVSGDHKSGGVLASRTEPANGDTNGLFTIIQPFKTTDPAVWVQNVLAGNAAPSVLASPDRVVAVIIAPGSPRTGQVRTPAVADVAGVFRQCALPTLDPATLNPSAELSAAQYLETYTNGAFVATNNSLLPAAALAPRIFVQADKDKERLNDQLIWITADEFAKAATKRTARIFATAINNFVTVNGFYPRPAAAPGGVCDPGLLQGFMPFICGAGATALNVGTRLNPVAPAAPALSPPAAVRAYDLDLWLPQTHYIVSESCVAGAGGVIGGPFCGGAARISVNGVASSPALLLMRGRPTTGQACLAGGNMSTCLEDPTNAMTVNSWLTSAVPIASVTGAAVLYQEPSAISNDYLVRFIRP